MLIGGSLSIYSNLEDLPLSTQINLIKNVNDELNT